MDSFSPSLHPTKIFSSHIDSVPQQRLSFGDSQLSEHRSLVLPTSEGLLSFDSIPSGERILYWGSGSPPAWRVQLALEEKGLPYRGEIVRFNSGVLQSPIMRAINPRGMVPIFIDGRDDCPAVVMYESLAILQYLNTLYPEPPLLPHGPRSEDSYARALMRMHEAVNLSNATGDVVFYLRRTPPEHQSREYLLECFAALNRELALWELYLSDEPYFGGQSPSMADLAFFPNLAYTVRCGKKLDSHFPRLHAYYERMLLRPSVQKTWPPHWRTVPSANLLAVEDDLLVVGGLNSGSSSSDDEASSSGTRQQQQQSQQQQQQPATTAEDGLSAAEEVVVPVPDVVVPPVVGDNSSLPPSLLADTAGDDVVVGGAAAVVVVVAPPLPPLADVVVVHDDDDVEADDDGSSTTRGSGVGY